MNFRHIEVERRGEIEIIRLNRPRYRNAQSRILLEEMTQAFARADLDNEVKVIVLAGAGDHFSAGHDLGTPDELEDRANHPFGDGVLGRVNRSWHLFVENSLRWRDVRKPTIAQVQGYCIFGGYMFASAMDLIVASDDAMFLPSITQYFSAPWDVGVRKAKEVLFQSRFVDAQEALRTGLANLVVPRAELERETLALAGRIAETDAFTLRMVKFALNNAQDAMGFHTAVRNAHSHHFLTRVQEYSQWDRGEGRGPKRMPGVAQALRKTAKAPEK